MFQLIVCGNKVPSRHYMRGKSTGELFEIFEGVLMDPYQTFDGILKLYPDAEIIDCATPEECLGRCATLA